MLRQVAERLKAELRDYDRIGRYGGEEFLIALPGCGADDAVRQAERLRLAVQCAPFVASEARLTVTISAGVAVDNRIRTVSAGLMVVLNFRAHVSFRTDFPLAFCALAFCHFELSRFPARPSRGEGSTSCKGSSAST